MKYTSSLPRQLRTAPRSSARGHQQVRGAGRLRAGGGERRAGLRTGLRAGPGSPPVPGGGSCKVSFRLGEKTVVPTETAVAHNTGRGFYRSWPKGEQTSTETLRSRGNTRGLSELRKLCHSQCLLFPCKIFPRQRKKKNPLSNSSLFG